MTNHVSSTISYYSMRFIISYLIIDVPNIPPFEKYQTSDFPALPPKSRIFRGCSLLWLRPIELLVDFVVGPWATRADQDVSEGVIPLQNDPFKGNSSLFSPVDLRRHPWGFIVSLARTNMAMWWAYFLNYWGGQPSMWGLKTIILHYCSGFCSFAGNGM